MATKTIQKIAIVCSRVPKTGYMTIGKNSSGTNQNAQVTFPALDISSAIIDEVRLNMPWNNSLANEGFQASTTHQATVNGYVYSYPISGSSGTATVALWGGWSNTQAFVVDLRGQSSNSNSTSKGYSQSPYIVVTYTPYTEPTAPTGLFASPNACEGALRLSWTRGSNGTNNPITGQDVRYQTSDDGVNWSAEVSVNVTASATFYDIPGATVQGWSRGKFVRFRVGSISQYTAAVYSGYSSSVRKNRAPHAPTGTPTTNKIVYAPGEVISISFTPPSPRDPDAGLSGDISGYEAKMQDTDGIDYNGGQIVGTNASPSATAVNVPTIGFTPGLQWRFLIRGYDSYGIRSDWSEPTEPVMIGTPLKVNVLGTLKTVAEQQVLVNGTLKQVSDIKVLVDGQLKNLTN